MAFAFVAVAHSVDATPVTSLACNKPTGTVDNDIMFAFIKRNDSTAPSVVPSGWTLTADNPVGGGNSFWLYHRVASSEGSSYTWQWAAGGRTGISIVTYRDGFDTTTPIDVVSDTVYTTSNTTVRAASMTVTAVNSPIIFFGATHATASMTYDTAPTTPTTLAEDVDYYDATGRFGRGIHSAVWTGSGATGDMDAVISSVQTDKHAFAVALVPSAGGSAAPRTLTLLGVG